MASLLLQKTVLLALGEKKRIYIATMFPFDEESKKRVAASSETCVKVRDLRRWNVMQVLRMYGSDKNSTVLLECMSNLVANEMFQESGAGENTVECSDGGD